MDRKGLIIVGGFALSLGAAFLPTSERPTALLVGIAMLGALGVMVFGFMLTARHG